MTLRVYAQVTSCENDQIEHNKCSSGCLTNKRIDKQSIHCYLGCTSLPLFIPAVQVFLVRGRQATTEPSQQLPSASWNEPQHHYLTHSRASGNQRESFELCRESGVNPKKSCTHLCCFLLLCWDAWLLLPCTTHLDCLVLAAKPCSFPKRVFKMNSYSNFGWVLLCPLTVLFGWHA